MLPVEVISLLRSPARREAFARDNAHLTYRFFDAVDGKQLSEATRGDAALFAPDLPYTDGAYGVALSHRALWQRAHSLNAVLTVAEDDAVFRGDFEEQHQ